MTGDDSHHRFVPDQRRRPNYVYRLQKWGSPDDLARVTPRTDEQYRQVQPDAAGTEPRLLLPQQRLQCLEAAVLVGLRHLETRPCSRRAGARRVLEAVGQGEADVAHQGHGRFEVDLGLAGMAD